MDLAQMLIRQCVRCFYEVKHVILVDALIIHVALRDDDMAYLMGTNTKDLHKVAGKLREDRLIAVHTRQELKEGQQRPISRTYYYIDYRATIDAIKWRVYLINKQVQGVTIPRDEIKAFRCRRCKAEWTLMDVLDRPAQGSLGFLCKTCGFLLEDIENNDQGGHEQSTKLNAQFRFITEILPKLDQVIIPESIPEQALESSRKVVRDETNPSYESAPVGQAYARPTAVRGLANVGPTSIAVTLTTGDGPTEADILAEQARKEKIAKQNAMPMHFSHSTITGEQIKFSTHSVLSTSVVADEKKEVALESGSANGDTQEIDDYFANLKAQQAREALLAKQEEDDDDDEDESGEEEFENAFPVSGSGSSGTAAGPLTNKSATVTGIKEATASTSGTSTNATSPTTGSGTPPLGGASSSQAEGNGGDERAAKRMKVVGSPPSKSLTAMEKESDNKDEEDESEEDMEFEDV